MTSYNTHDELTPDGPPVPVGSTAEPGAEFAAAVSPNGDLLVTSWTAPYNHFYGSPGNQTEVYSSDIVGSVYAPGGQLLGQSSFVLNTVSAPDYVAAAALPNGSFAVTVEYSEEQVDFGVNQNFVVSRSGSITTSSGAGPEGTPAVAALANGDFVLGGETFTQSSTGWVGTQVAQVYDPSGNAVGPALTIASGFSSSTTPGPMVAYGSGGDFVTATPQGDATPALYNFNGGSGFEAAVPMPFQPSGGALLANGDMVFVGMSGSTVEAQIYDPSTNALVGGPVIIDQNAADKAPNVVATADNGYVVDWSTGDPNGLTQARAVGPAGDMGAVFTMSGRLVGAEANGDIVAVREDSQRNYWEQTYLATLSGSHAPNETFIAENNSGTTLTGGAGNDTLVASQGPDVLTGGPGADSFIFPAIPWSAGKITDFTPGTDTIDLSALFQAAHYAGTDPVGDGWLSFTSDGAAGTDVWFNPHDGSNSGYPYLITDVQDVLPVQMNDSDFVFSSSTTGGGGSGGTGSGGGTVTTLTAPNDNGTTLTAGSGDYVLVASHGPDVLVAGSGPDTFEFPVIPWSAGHIEGFNPSLDQLDLAPLFQAAGYTGSDPVADGWLSFTSDGSGDTLVYFNPHDGSNSGYPYLITTLDGVAPSAITSQDVIFSSSTGGGGGSTTTTLTAPNDNGTTLTAGSGDYILVASHGPDTLVAGSGPDTFEFPVIPWSAGQIEGFDPSQDQLDLAPLFHAAGYTGSDPVADGWLCLTPDGKGDTLVYFNPHDGSNSGYPYLITTIDNVAPSAINPSHDLIFT